MQLTQQQLKTTTQALWAAVIIIGVIGVLTIAPRKPAPQTSEEATATAAAEQQKSAKPQPIVIASTPAQSPELELLTVKVKPNETLWQLARKHCGSHRFIESIAAYNGIADSRKIRSGETLTIVCALK